MDNKITYWIIGIVVVIFVLVLVSDQGGLTGPGQAAGAQQFSDLTVQRLVVKGKLAVGLENVGQRRVEVAGAIKADAFCFGENCFRNVCPEGSKWYLSQTECPSTPGQLVFSSSVIGSVNERIRRGNDTIALITLSAGGGDVVVRSMAFKLAGSAITSGTPILPISIIDPQTNRELGTATCHSDDSSCSVTLLFGDALIPQGFNKRFWMVLDSSSFADNPRATDSLSVVIEQPGNVDLIKGAVRPIDFPVTIVGISYR